MKIDSILNQYIDICGDVLNGVTAKLNKRFKIWLMETLLLYMVIPGRINFLQLGRYSDSCEQRFRQNFSKDFDWLSFNLVLAQQTLSGTRKALAIDPSYISKSGKHTPWLGYFWSGCAGAAKRGLELLGTGLIDVDNKDCVSLLAEQSPDSKTLGKVKSTLIDWYLHIIGRMKEQVQLVTRYVVADAYFAKNSFASGLLEMDFHLISRFRDDVVLLYHTHEMPTGKKGRPRLFDGKIDMDHLDFSRMEEIQVEGTEGQLYTIVAYAKALKKSVRVVIWYSPDKKTRKVYFSTDVTMSGKDVIEYYRTRFQIEFCFRNAKQHTGLVQCQARSIEKLRFHFNASLTAVNIAKLLAKKRGIPFSMASLKTMIHNEFLLKRFIKVSGIRPNKRLNEKLRKELVQFATMTA